MFGVKYFEIYQRYIVMSTYEASQLSSDSNGNLKGVINAITKADENYNLKWKISFKNSSTFDFIKTISDESNVFVVIISKSLISWFYKLDFTTGQLIQSKCNQYLQSNINVTNVYFDALISINSDYFAFDLSNQNFGVNYLVKGKN